MQKNFLIFLKASHFYVIKLPYIYMLMMAGFIFDFLVSFPFLLMYSTERWFSAKTRSQTTRGADVR